MTKIIDGKAVSALVREEIRNEVIKLNRKGIFPGLAVIKVGHNPASEIYVRNKILGCAQVGIKSFSYNFEETVSQDEVISLINKLNSDDGVNGILIQLPLPRHISEKEVLEKIDPKKDVDGFSAESIGNLALGKSGFRSCTPFGVMKLLEYSNIDVEGKIAVVIGRSNIVGKPMALMLLEKNATVIVCHSRTKNLSSITKLADILVAAVGKAHFVTANMVKEGAVVIDVGMNKLDGKTVGDVDFENVKDLTSAITPVPGGVGPMTITMLLYNTLQSAAKSNG